MAHTLKAAGRKKIVIFCAELHVFQHHRGHLVTDFIANGFAVDVYANPVGKVDADLGFRFFPLDIARFSFSLFSDFKLFLAVLKAIRSEPDASLYLLHLKPYLYGSLATVLARWLGWRGKLMIAVAGLGRLYEPRAFQFGKAWAYRVIVESVLKLSIRQAIVTFETKSDRDMWVKRGLISKNQTLLTRGTGINLDKFPQRSPAQPETLHVLFAGRLLQLKGLPAFMGAATKLSHQTLPLAIKMMVAGAIDSDPDSVDRALLEDHPNLTYLGHVENMSQLLQKTDVVVLPSFYKEGVPRILIEAAATGCLIIATRFAGSEMLIEDHKTGIFLNGNTQQEITDELVECLTAISQIPEKFTRYGANAAAVVRQSGFDDTTVSKAITGFFLDRS